MVVHWQNPDPLQELASLGCGASFSFLLRLPISLLLHLPMFTLPNAFILFPLAFVLNLVPRHI